MKPVETQWKFADDPETPMGRRIRDGVNDLINRHHEHLSEAVVRVLFRTDLPDRNGKIVLGRAVVLSERDRLLSGVDLVIALNALHWATMPEKHRVALLDHELCHFGLKARDDAGRPVRDSSGRILYRLRPHDLEEFNGVVLRHGLWISDVRHLVEAAALSPDAEQLALVLERVRGEAESG